MKMDVAKLLKEKHSIVSHMAEVVGVVRRTVLGVLLGIQIIVPLMVEDRDAKCKDVNISLTKRGVVARLMVGVHDV